MRTRVRCLGPDEREHWFFSTGPWNRVCTKCRAVINKNSIPRMLEKVCKVTVDPRLRSKD